MQEKNPALRVTLSAFIALVVAMGIGRFAFTPQVPLMIGEQQLSLTSAGVVAALNYLGYLCGAFDAMRATRHVERRLRWGVWAAVVLTLLSACADQAWQHGIIRFLIGWASGWAMVLVAVWSNEQLLHHGRPDLSAAVFAGPGTGIVISGMVAVVLHGLAVSAALAWVTYGLLALLLIALIARYLPRLGDIQRSDAPVEPLRMTPALRCLIWSYSLAGFGYILPATFMSQIAAACFPDSAFAQFVWPVFGGASVIGIVLGIATRHLGRTHQRLALVLWAQAVGIFAADAVSGISGLVMGAILVGGGFLCVVQLTLQYARELAPKQARYLAGLLTTGYAIGQLVGPLLSALSSHFLHRLEPALWVAGFTTLLAGALVWCRRA